MAEETRRVKYEITAENRTQAAFNAVKANFADVSKQANGFKAALAGIGITTLFAGLAAQTTELIKATAALDDLSEKTGASVESLSRLQQVAKIGGHDFEGATDALVKFSKALAGTDDETKGAGRALATLGLDADKLRQLDPGEAFVVLAKRLNEFQDSGGKTALILELLGKSGAKFLPLLKDIAQESGVAAKVTAEQAAAAEKLEKSLNRLAVESGNAKTALANQLVPTLINIVEQFNEGRKAAGGFLQAILLLGTTNPFKTTGESLKGLREELDGLQSDRARQLRSGPVDVSGLDLAIAATQKRIEFAKFLQRQDALASAGGDTPGEAARMRARLGDLSGFKSTPAPKPLTLGPRNEEADQVLKLNRAVAEAGLSIDREINQQRLAALEQYNGASLLSIRDYYKLRGDIAQNALQQELGDIDRQIAAEQARIAQARSDFAAANRQGTPEGVQGAQAANAAIVDSETKLIKLQAERQKAQIAASGQLSTLSLQEKTAVDNLSGAVVNLNAQLLAIRGDTAAAALLQFGEANRRLRQDLVTNFGADSAEVAKLDRLEQQTVAQERFNVERQTLDDINARLAISEERIALAQKNGSINELEGLRQTGELRRAAAADLERQLQVLKDIAATAENPRLQLMIEQTQIAIARLRSETDLLGDKFRQVFQDAAVNPLVDFITRTKSAGEAFRDFARGVLRDLATIEAKKLATGLFGKEGILGGVLGGVFGGKGGSPAAVDPLTAEFASSAAGGAAANGIASLFGKLFGFATGGSFTVGGSGGTDSQLVAFRASPNERVTVQTPAQQRAGPGPMIVQHNTFNGPLDRAMLLTLLEQNKQETVALVADLRQRGGGFSAAMGR